MVNRNDYSKVSKVVNGGAARTDSTRAAILALDGYDDDVNIMFHDAGPPVPLALDHRLASRESGVVRAVDVVVPSADTLVTVDDAGFITDIPDRSTIRRGQTPQAFKLGIIRRAYEYLSEHPAGRHLRCGVVRQALPVHAIATVEGEAANIKVTEPIDLFLADKLSNPEATPHRSGRATADRRAPQRPGGGGVRRQFRDRAQHRRNGPPERGEGPFVQPPLFGHRYHRTRHGGRSPRRVAALEGRIESS